MTPSVYLNGRFVDSDHAVVSVYDGGWLHGAGLFETMRAEQGRIFRLESHLARLRGSAERLLSPVSVEDLPDSSDFRELLDRNGLKDARVRLTVSAGAMREDTDPDARRLTIVATAAALASYPETLYQTGVQVSVCGFQQSPTDPLAGHKTTAYLPRLLALREAQSARCTEAIWFTTRHELAEGSISNIFLVTKGVLRTPPLDTPVLPGIARGVVLEIARRDRLEAIEGPLSINDLLDADEVFLTNSIMQVLPVIRVEKRDIGSGQVGSVTRQLLHEYRELVREECDGV